MDKVPIEYLDELGLWIGRKFVAHNAAFEAMMLAGRPIELIDSMQLAGLVLGCEFGSRTLANVAEQVLGIEAPKEQQASDWGARFLSIPQINYAAADAVIPHRAARAMWPQLSNDERRCFKVQNAAVSAIAHMRLTGCAFVPEIHRETTRKWELEHAEERARFKNITGEEPPARDKVGRWLEARLPAEKIAWMPRTESGTVSARSDPVEAPGALRGDPASAPGASVRQAAPRVRPQAARGDQPDHWPRAPGLHARHQEREACLLGAEFSATAGRCAPRDRGAGRPAAPVRGLRAGRAAHPR
jgi:hypothetical protein